MSSDVVKPVRRIGLYGGSFDPVHQAHRQLADVAWQQLGLTELRWIPVGQPWQKSRQLAPKQHRAAMVALAIGDNPGYVLERCELERDGPSYTVDTVLALQARHASDLETAEPSQWFLILGQDQLSNFCTWHRWETLLQRVTLAVAGRAGTAVEVPPAVQQQLLATGMSVARLDMPPMAVSSTELRQRLAAGTSALTLAPDRLAPDVARYIQAHGLYHASPSA